MNWIGVLKSRTVVPYNHQPLIPNDRTSKENESPSLL
jgi:hypothetical protein